MSKEREFYLVKKQKEFFAQGYQTALKDCLDDLVMLHRAEPQNQAARKVVDEVWDIIKRRLNSTRSIPK